MLTDTLVERYSRQILLPDVGGRGQERLGAAAVVLSGSATGVAATLLAAAGVPVVCEVGVPGVVEALVDSRHMVRAYLHQSGGTVLTLVGRPCGRCAPTSDSARTDAAEPDVAGAQAIEALLAAEVLRVALGLTAAGRSHTVDLARGVFEGHPLARTAGCAACAEAE
jgi:adenylyltransferase/sulfurtransferase